MSLKICYAPDGSSRNEQANVAEGAIYAPCDNTAEVSMCCAIGPVRDGTADICLGNGLCRNDVLWNGLFWRESCTDPTWEDPACIKLFLNGTGFNNTVGTIIQDDGWPVTDVNITACDNGSWCAGENNRGCCQNGEGVFVLNGQQVDFNPNATTTTSFIVSPTTTFTTSSIISPSASTSTASTSPGKTDLSDKGLSTGAQAGIGVSVAIVTLLILAIIVWFFRKKRNVVRPQLAELGGEPAPAMLETPQPRHELPSPPSNSTGLYDSPQHGTSDSGSFPSKRESNSVERYA